MARIVLTDASPLVGLSIVDQRWLRVWSRSVPQLPLPDLDEGDSACIRIAIAHIDDALLLIDERAAVPSRPSTA